MLTIGKAEALGGFITLFLDPHYLSLVGVGLIALSIVVAEAAHRGIARPSLRVHHSRPF
ncbi:hypothetical protein [Bordetella genomosp. 11]|uniref:hypothetical protein n=1 Tax=Bordetella genomosp. 11 TaxID=1416808 RepID=UPI0015960340|nr:hypothetical protein [Bordetella genomosp. 11]